MIKHILAMGVALGALTASTVQAASDTADKAKLFGAREAVEQASLSPDGTKVALVQALPGQGSAVYVTDLSIAGQLTPRQVFAASGRPERIEYCRWASNDRLLCKLFGLTRYRNTYPTYISRLFALNADGTDMKVVQNRSVSSNALWESMYGGDVLDWSTGEDGHVLMLREYIPEVTVGTLTAQTKNGLGIDDINTTTLRTRMIEPPRKGANEYITDGKGTVRIMGVREYVAYGYSTEERRYFYRETGKREWLPFSKIDDRVREGFDPYGVDPALNLAYGLNEVDGRLAAFSKAMDGSGKETLLFAHPQVDVDDFMRVGRNRRIIGVSYATDQRRAVYFDPAMDKLAKAISRGLPDQPLINFLDASQDESRLIVQASSDILPARYYLLDRKTNHMEELGASRPHLTFPLAPVRAVSYPAADGAMVPAYLMLPPSGKANGLPAIVMPHGGPEARDEWGFDWLAQFFASQGYAVLQPNYRGSIGYGDAWFQKNGFQSWRAAISDVADAGRWLVKEGIARPDKLAIFGWSYGGYAALQSAVTDPGLFKAVIAVAPVTDLDKLRQDHLNWSDYQVISRYIGMGPHVGEGSPARHAENIKVPVLMFHGTMDLNVDDGHSRLMDERIRAKGGSSQLVIYDGFDHYLEDSVTRADMLTKSAAFLDKALNP